MRISFSLSKVHPFIKLSSFAPYGYKDFVLLANLVTIYASFYVIRRIRSENLIKLIHYTNIIFDIRDIYVLGLFVQKVQMVD